MMKKLRSVGVLMTVLSASAWAETRVIENEHSTSMQHDGQTLWTYNHDPAEGKPYIHPLATITGTVFTALRPDDHPWHRGVWFSWKKINGVSYWEENRETGKSPGETRIKQFKRSIAENQDVQFDLDIEYAPAGSNDMVLTEQRSVTISVPDSTGMYIIDWSTTFQALDKDVVFERTPPPHEPKGYSYGGYAGLSVRMNGKMRRGTYVNSSGEIKPHRNPANWMLFKAPESGSLLFMDHPDNLNTPSVWYLDLPMSYFSPAILYNAPHTLEAGQTLSLKYRLVVSSEAMNDADAESSWKAWNLGANQR
ncbi:PmoA family protein [Coraliomargarita akajimensis]|nr:PmoA family protein [Coraliomargarita akajimensis]